MRGDGMSEAIAFIAGAIAMAMVWFINDTSPKTSPYRRGFEDGLSRLEELNSDYINEHFGDLQDTAYKKGFEDGKEYGLEESDMREAVSYQRGLEDGKAVNDKGCEG